MNLDDVFELSKEFLDVNPDDLESALVSQSRLYFLFNVAYVKSKKEYEKALAEFGRVSFQIREEAEKNVTKKLTEKYIESYVNSSEKIIEAKNKISELESQLELVKGLLKALEQRRDMIVQLSSNKRAETKLIGN